MYIAKFYTHVKVSSIERVSHFIYSSIALPVFTHRMKLVKGIIEVLRHKKNKSKPKKELPSKPEQKPETEAGVEINEY